MATHVGLGESGGASNLSVSNFEALGLNDWIVSQMQQLGIKKPTKVQNHCIPEILKGRDCIGCAKTGSGKTAAFALPILQKLCEDPYGIFALIITPTRELAFQICEQIQVLGKPINVRVTVIIGGLSMTDQGGNLSEQPHIVVSTPGRLADHITSCNTFSLKKIRFLVLDEADRLLDEDFGVELETIFEAIPKKRQTLLFSATITESLEQMRDSSLNNIFVWMDAFQTKTVEELDQRYVLMAADVKDAYLIHILHKYMQENRKSSVIVFTKSCKFTHVLRIVLQELGMKCVILHSMMQQTMRLAALTQFKSNKIRLLVATDLASRGLDIPTVDLIINHNVPNSPKTYVHRVGRTARAGRGGLAITLVTQFDIKLVHAIEAFTNHKMTEHPTNEKEVLKILTEVALTRREAEIHLEETDFGENKEIYKRKAEILAGIRETNEKKSKRKRKKNKKEDKEDTFVKNEKTKTTDEETSVKKKKIVIDNEKQTSVKKKRQKNE